MKIVSHRLKHDDDTPYPFVETANKEGKVDHRYLVIHYTAGRSAESSVDWFSKPEAKASAHLVIGRDGSITQMVPFDRIALHAGTSRWKGLTGLNRFSLGIELDNAGELKRVGGRWTAWFGKTYDDDVVLEAAHRNGGPVRGWHTFTGEQIEAALEVSSLLRAKYDLKEVLGHDDIAPERKVDPGPAFPMASFRARLMGRSEIDEPEWRTTATLNIRSGPGTHHATLEGSPLPPDTPVQVIRHDGNWRLVTVLSEVNGVMDLEGWVHGRFLAE